MELSTLIPTDVGANCGPKNAISIFGVYFIMEECEISFWAALDKTIYKCLLECLYDNNKIPLFTQLNE